MRALARVTAGLGIALFLVVIGFAIALGDPARVIGAVAYLAFPLVGLVIARRDPRNTVAWAFLGSALLLGLESVGDTTSQYGVHHGWPEPAVHLGVWATGWTWFPGLFLVITIGLAHFPDGRPLSRRWRWLDVATLVLLADFALGVGLGIWVLPAATLLKNQTPNPPGWHRAVFEAGYLAFPLIVPCVVGAVVSLILRWRRASTLGRLQIRWVAAAGIVAVTVEAAGDVIGSLPGVNLPADFQTLGESCGFALVAIATGVAIMRYRLYEIDRIVSRTLGWTVVTALLVGTYLGLAAAAAAVIPDRYGSVGVAAATLAVAALFVPVRRRIQRAVDRRFDRARYDAARIVDGFAVRVRAEVDGATLDAELLATVQAAVAPATASVWLAPTGGQR